MARITPWLGNFVLLALLPVSLTAADPVSEAAKEADKDKWGEAPERTSARQQRDLKLLKALKSDRMDARFAAAGEIGRRHGSQVSPDLFEALVESMVSRNQRYTWYVVMQLRKISGTEHEPTLSTWRAEAETWRAAWAKRLEAERLKTEVPEVVEATPNPGTSSSGGNDPSKESMEGMPPEESTPPSEGMEEESDNPPEMIPDNPPEEGSGSGDEGPLEPPLDDMEGMSEEEKRLFHEEAKAVAEALNSIDVTRTKGMPENLVVNPASTHPADERLAAFAIDPRHPDEARPPNLVIDPLGDKTLQAGGPIKKSLQKDTQNRHVLTGFGPGGPKKNAESHHFHLKDGMEESAFRKAGEKAFGRIQTPQNQGKVSSLVYPPKKP